MQTRTAVHSLEGAKKQRSTAEAQAYFTMCSLMLFSQMMLYGSLGVLPEAGNASWWLAALMALPALAAWGVLRWATWGGLDLAQALGTGLGRIGAGAAGILYGLLLGVDVQFALSGLTELTAAFVIEDGSVWQLAPWGAAAGIAGVWLGREMGAARCCYLMRWLLAAVLTGCVIAALPMGDAAFLFPWQFESLQRDMHQGLLWSGSLWPVVLTGFLPAGASAQRMKRSWTVLLGIAGVLLLFFGYCFVLPAFSFREKMTWGERMVVFLRASPSKLMWEILLIFKMLVLLLNVCAAASLAGRLITRLALPKVHPGLWATLIIGAAVPLAASHTQWCQEVLIMVGPWRLPMALAPLFPTGAVLAWKRRKKQL